MLGREERWSPCTYGAVGGIHRRGAESRAAGGVGTAGRVGRVGGECC